MDLAQEVTRKLTAYPGDQFYIDEHAYNRCRYDHQDLDLEDVLQRLRTRDFDRAEVNDSANPPLDRHDSYIIYIRKSNQYRYAIVLYLLEEKPLIKTVQRLDRAAQERLQP